MYLYLMLSWIQIDEYKQQKLTKSSSRSIYDSYLDHLHYYMTEVRAYPGTGI